MELIDFTRCPIDAGTKIIRTFIDLAMGQQDMTTDDFLERAQGYKDRKLSLRKSWSDDFFGNDCFVIENHTFTDNFDLSDLEFDFGVIFKNCKFEDHIRLTGCKFNNLHFWGCKIETLDGYGLETVGNLALKTDKKEQFEANGQVRLVNAKIGGSLSFDGGKFHARGFESFKKYASAINRYSIDATNIEIGGSLVINDTRRRDGSEKDCDFISYGHVSFHAAKIGKTLTARGARFIAGTYCDDSGNEQSDFRKVGQTWGYVFGQCLDLKAPDHNQIKNINADKYKSLFRRYIEAVISLDLYEARIGASAHFSYETISIGTIRMGGCEIAGKLSFKGAKLYEIEAIDENNLDANRAAREMARSIVYYGGTSKLPWGALDAVNVKIGSSLYLCSLKTNTEDSSNCGNFWSFGRISFVGATIDGRLNIGGGHFFKSDDYAFKEDKGKPEEDKEPLCETSSPDRYRIRGTSALDFSRATVRLDFESSNDTVIIGRLSLDGSDIKGRISLTQTTIIAYFRDRDAISARGCKIGSTLGIENHCAIAGCVNFKGANIGSTVTLLNSVFTLGRPNGGSFYGEESSNDNCCGRGGIFEECFKIVKKPEINEIKFKDDTSNNPFSQTFVEALKSGLKLDEEWKIERDRRWNPTLALNFHRAKIAGSFHVSYHKKEAELQSKRVSEDNNYKYSALIAGKLNLLDAAIEGNLRLYISNVKVISQDLREVEHERDRFKFQLSQMLENILERNVDVKEMPARAINLSGADVGSFALSENILNNVPLQIEGLRYERLVGENFQKPEFVKLFILKTTSGKKKMQDISSAKYMRSYYQKLGNDVCIVALDKIISILNYSNQNKDRRGCILDHIYRLKYLARFGFYLLFAWFCLASIVYKVFAPDIITTKATSLLWLLAYLPPFISSYYLYKNWKKNNVGNDLKLINDTLNTALNFNQIQHIVKSFINYGHSYIRNPMLLLLTVWLMSFATILVIYYYDQPHGILNAGITSLEICLPTTGLVSSNIEHNLLDKIKEDNNMLGKLLIRYLIVFGKITGWSMLSIIIAGYIKNLKDK